MNGKQITVHFMHAQQIIIILALNKWKFVLKKLNIFGNASNDFSDYKNWWYFLILSWVFSMHHTSP